MSDTQAPTPSLPDNTSAIEIQQATAGGDGLSMQEHRDAVQWGLDHGKIDRARAEKEMDRAGNQLPLADAPAKAISTPAEFEGDVETLPGFEPAEKSSDYRLPDANELNKVLTAGKAGAELTPADTMHIQEQVGGWLHAGRLPPAIGTAIANIAGRHIAEMPGYDTLQAGAKDAYRITERSKLDRMWGDQAPANIALATQLVKEIEAKKPGIVAFLEVTGLGNNSNVIAQLAGQARRLYSKAK